MNSPPETSAAGAMRTGVAERDAACFVDRLPNELLVSIFKAGSQTMATNPQFLLLVSRVCSRWRRVAFTAPELWSIINICTLDELSIAYDFIERAGCVPLHVHIGDYPYDDSLFHQSVSLIRPHIPRLKSLELDIDFQVVDICISLVMQMEGNSLEHLRIHLLSPLPWEAGRTNDYTFIRAENFPSLRFLNLRGVRARFGDTPYSCLSRLVIQAYAPNSADMRAMFNACPVLAVLILPGFCCPLDWDEDEEDTRPIVSASLRSLAFDMMDHHPTRHCECPLSLIEAPNLEYLQITNSRPPTVHSPTNTHDLLNRKKHPKLHTLRLEYSDGFMDAQAMPAVPSLQRLELVCQRGPLDDVAPVHMPELFSFPKISSLYFVPDGEWREEHYSWLKAVARLRADTKSPFVIETSTLPEQEHSDALQNKVGDNVIARISPSRGLISFQDFTSFTTDESELTSMSEDELEFHDDLWEDYSDYSDFHDQLDDDYEHDPFEEDDGLDMVDMG